MVDRTCLRMFGAFLYCLPGNVIPRVRHGLLSIRHTVVLAVIIDGKKIQLIAGMDVLGHNLSQPPPPKMGHPN